MRSAIKAMQPVIAAQRDRDVSEADTVTMVKDLLADCFGYDKYSELTSEHAIRGTYCDLVVQVEGKVRFIVEVKAVGISLNEKHVKQAVDYAANKGIEWVVLTNGARWIVFKVVFKKPIDHREIASFDILSMTPKDEAGLEQAFLLTREGLSKGTLREFTERKEATGHHMVAAVLLTEPVLSCVRREMRRVTGVMVELDALEKVLREEVMKREALDGADADACARKVTATARRVSAEREEASEEAQAASGTSPRIGSLSCV